MKCTACFKELNEGNKAYATVAGSIEQLVLIVMKSVFTLMKLNRG